MGTRGFEDHGELREMNGNFKGCVICNSVRDKGGKYCRDCWKVMKKGYNPQAIKALGMMTITVAQKRRCVSCRILPTCIEVGNVHDGCNTIFKSLLDKEAKEKIKSLGRRVSG